MSSSTVMEEILQEFDWSAAESVDANTRDVLSQRNGTVTAFRAITGDFISAEDAAAVAVLTSTSITNVDLDQLVYED